VTKRILSIGFFLQAAAGLMAAILLTIFSIYALHALGNKERATRIPRLAAISSEMFTAVENLRLERSAVNTALFSRGPLDREAAYEIETLRERSKQSLNSALNKCNQKQNYYTDFLIVTLVR